MRELGLGEFTPSKSERVVVLDSFIFEKTKGRVVRQSQKMLKLHIVPKLMVTTETPLMDDTKIDPIAIASTCVAFSQALELNFRNMA